MSVNRENVIWQSADGTWSRGFYDFYTTGDDYEWDVEYDFNSFRWVACGYLTVEEAIRAWDGANPGGWNELHYTDESAPRIAKLDDMAACLYESADRWNAKGTPKRRTVAAVQAERDAAVTDWVRARSDGYDNPMSDRVGVLDERLAGMYQRLNSEERAAFDARDADRRAEWRARLEAARERYRQSNRTYRYRFGGYGSFGLSDRSAKFDEVEAFLDGRDKAAVERATSVPPSTAGSGTPTPPAGRSRAKTTPKSTPGSFAPRHRTDPGSSVV